MAGGFLLPVMKIFAWEVALAVFLAFSPFSDAFWRLPCRARSGAARIDPLMAFGTIGDHVHVIHGSGGKCHWAVGSYPT